MIFLNTEIEARILDVNKDELIKKLEKLGTQKVGDYEPKKIYMILSLLKHTNG